MFGSEKRPHELFQKAPASADLVLTPEAEALAEEIIQDLIPPFTILREMGLNSHHLLGESMAWINTAFGAWEKAQGRRHHDDDAGPEDWVPQEAKDYHAVAYPVLRALIHSALSGGWGMADLAYLLMIRIPCAVGETYLGAQGGSAT